MDEVLCPPPQTIETPWKEKRLVFKYFGGKKRWGTVEDGQVKLKELEEGGLCKNLTYRPSRQVKRLPDGSCPQEHDPPLPVEWEDHPERWELNGERRDLQGEMQRQFAVQTRSLKRHGPIEVQIIHKTDGEWKRVGGYERNYPSLFRTFYPFLHHGKPFALYSSSYSSTRVMSLPDCVDIGGEPADSNGFCPTAFYVPYDPMEGCHGDFGFVSGCIWGDDASWKVEFLDLSRVAEGVIKRSARFGYVELPNEMELHQAIHLDWSHGPCKPYFEIIRKQTFNLETGEADE